MDPPSLFLCVRTLLMVCSFEFHCEPQREWSYAVEQYVECVSVEFQFLQFFTGERGHAHVCVYP